MTLEPPDSVWIRGDRRAIKLLLDNLIDNALKYTNDAPHIAIKARRVEGFALVTIADRGQGFDPKDTPTLFRRFGRGDTTKPGTGLGLSLSQAIARGHGGDAAELQH